MQISLVLAIIIVSILIVVLPTITLIVFANNKKVLKILGIIFFILFIIGLSALVFGCVTFSNGTITLTFVSTHEWFNSSIILASWEKGNVLLNIVMLFPVSAFVFSLNTKHTFIKTIIIGFAISFFIELFQFVLPISRTTELLDIVLNTLSAAIGYLYFYLINKIATRKQS